MDPRLSVRLLGIDQRLAAQRRDEEFRAMCRRPDALPEPDDPPETRGERFRVIRMLARTAALLRVFGR